MGDCCLVATSFRAAQTYTESACKTSPSGTRFNTVRYVLASRFHPRSQVAECGAAPGLFSLDCLPIAEGVLPSPPLYFSGENYQGYCSEWSSGGDDTHR